MDELIEELYRTFASYRLGNDFSGCSCCVPAKSSQELAKRPLRELTFQELDHYSRHAITGWGNVRHFKHFLPRLLELSVAERDDVYQRVELFVTIQYAGFSGWIRSEREVVFRFLAEWWKLELGIEPWGESDDAIAKLLCAVSRVSPSVQSYLDSWLERRTQSARRHLAAFIQQQAPKILKKGALDGPFWIPQDLPQREILNWLRSDAVKEFLSGLELEDTEYDGSFSYAQPLIESIRQMPRIQ